MISLRERLLSRTPSTVGALTDPDALTRDFSARDCDVVELRLDALGHGPDVLAFAARHRGILPLLITARGPEEGGRGQRTLAQRREALECLLPHAAAIDIELRSLTELAEVWTAAAQAGVIRIASAHDFQRLPADEEILLTLDAMARSEAEVAKIAYQLADEEELARLAAAARSWGVLPLSFMGMGSLGPASRVLAILSGSVLNYGFLGSEATAPGQWPAHLLKEVTECSPT